MVVGGVPQAGSVASPWPTSQQLLPHAVGSGGRRWEADKSVRIIQKGMGDVPDKRQEISNDIPGLTSLNL